MNNFLMMERLGEVYKSMVGLKIIGLPGRRSLPRKHTGELKLKQRAKMQTAGSLYEKQKRIFSHVIAQKAQHDDGSRLDLILVHGSGRL
jgi:hypothetical protein